MDTKNIHSFEANERNTTSSSYQKRKTAIKISIAHLRRSEFVQTDSLLPNYVKTQYGPVTRVNIIGILVSKNETNSSCIISDKTSIISIQNQFSDNKNISLEQINVGDSILVIGKPRIFNDDMYIVPEIVKKIEDPLWLKVREKELFIQESLGFQIEDSDYEQIQTTKQDSINNEIKNIQTFQNNTSRSNKNKSTFETIESKNDSKEEIHDSFEIVQEFIKKNDSGQGVLTTELLEELQNKNVQEPEKMIKKLLEYGEIFEIMPGKIKLLL